MKKVWQLEPGAKVVFVSPDMNWDDVRAVLGGSSQVSVVNGEGNFVEDRKTEYIGFFQEVRAFTDLSSPATTFFCLSGMAHVGMTKDQMEKIFWSVRRFCMEHEVTRDPYVWPILPALRSWQWHYMQLISGSVELSEAFIRGDAMDAIVTEHILLTYKQR